MRWAQERTQRTGKNIDSLLLLFILHICVEILYINRYNQINKKLKNFNTEKNRRKWQKIERPPMFIGWQD